MKKAVVYVHGKSGSAEEAKHYEQLLPEYDVIGFDYRAENPWEAKPEFAEFFGGIFARYDEVTLIANSIGAYFSLHTLAGQPFKQAYLISPVTDMEGLILDMMKSAGVTESELERRGEIPTEFGETLSWEYLSYLRANPIEWGKDIPTRILCGGNDSTIRFSDILEFAGDTFTIISIMKNGGHWFHTEEQMEFLDGWILNSIK